MLIISSPNPDNSLAARERAAGELVFVEKDDNAALRRLESEAENYDIASNNGRRLECYLVFAQSTSLWLLQSAGISKTLESKVDIFATTFEDIAAKSIFIKLPDITLPFPSLDRKPIMRESDSIVHLVIFGSTPQAEAIAINAALIAHYPNYCRDTQLRTRISVIDDNVNDIQTLLTQRYVHLFEHSYYRTLDLSNPEPGCITSPPANKDRKDFVDIEWEFVRGNIRNEAVRQKLREWSASTRQQLTLAICHPDHMRNLSEAVGMPQEVYDNEIPVLCHASHNDLLRLLPHESAYKNIHTFSAASCSIKILKVLRMLAQRVNYVYNHCFSLAPGDPITAPSSIDKELLELQWNKVGSLTKQYSNIFNAMTLGTKMHSIGHTPDDWREYFALTLDEITLLSEVEHNRWSVEELILGYRPANDEETQLVDNDISQKKILRTKKIHYDLRAYDELKADVTGKNVNVYDMALIQGIPLIIQSCITD